MLLLPSYRALRRVARSAPPPPLPVQCDNSISVTKMNKEIVTPILQFPLLLPNTTGRVKIFTDGINTDDRTITITWCNYTENHSNMLLPHSGPIEEIHGHYKEEINNINKNL